MKQQVVIGIDEAGRGPVAGPIVAAAVLSRGLKKEQDILSRVKDSKKLSVNNREALFFEIIESIKVSIKNSEELIVRYKKQLENIKNNREFTSLTKELEFQELEIELFEKKIKEIKAKVLMKDEVILSNTDFKNEEIAQLENSACAGKTQCVLVEKRILH